MATIGEVILEKETSKYQNIINKLQEINAPEILITTLQDRVNALKTEGLKLAGNKELLTVQMEDMQIATGRGGKTYLKFNQGKILYFPNTRYGPYIKLAE